MQQLADVHDIPHTNLYYVLHQFGEDTLNTYIDSYQRNVSSPEAHFISLCGNFLPTEKYDKNPQEFSINRRPDFRLEINDRVLYVNIDGLYDHMEGGRRSPPKDYHLNLFKDFKEAGQVFFQFREDEVRDKAQIVESIVRNYLHLPKEKIYARRCVCKKVTKQDSQRFLQENHLMGTHKASTSYGLYVNNDLKALVSIRRIGEGIDIARFVTKINTTVVGGLGKLLSYVEKIYAPKFIQSFCDLRYSTGVSYEKLGFHLINVNLSWKWTDGKNTFNRLRCRANMDERKLTQVEHAKELGWYKIYDAGQAKYIKNC